MNEYPNIDSSTSQKWALTWIRKVVAVLDEVEKSPDTSPYINFDAFIGDMFIGDLPWSPKSSVEVRELIESDPEWPSVRERISKVYHVTVMEI